MGLSKSGETKIIGITGAARAVGTTSFAFALAEYLRAIGQYKVALVEMNSHQDFRKICTTLKKAKMEEDHSFSNGRITFYAEMSKFGISKIFNEDYDYIIIDYGHKFHNIESFLRCSYKIVCASTYPWKLPEYQQLLTHIEEIKGSDKWLHVISGDEKIYKNIQRKYNIATVRMPYIQDIEKIDGISVEFFQKII